jgi:AGZA family xanthine/uracil permease-like MFS transporter
LTEAIATLIAGVCGGVSQSTPYIGHPAYKKMGGRAAYTLATGLFIGAGGCLGFIQTIVDVIPATAVMPILLFIGFEILNQGYRECPNYMSAVSFALLPCVAELIRIVVTGYLHVDVALLSTIPGDLGRDAVQAFNLIGLLGHGFILTALLWGGASALIMERKIRQAALYFFICALFNSFGLIHSASPDGGLYLPWNAPNQTSLYFTAGYVALGALLIALSLQSRVKSMTHGAPVLSE